MKTKCSCHICNDRLLNYKEYPKCSKCLRYSHPKCNDITQTDASILLKNSNLLSVWTCKLCSDTEYIPFSSNPNDGDCHACSNSLGKNHVICTICDHAVHDRCNNLQLGCNTCIADIFPHNTDLFHTSSAVNDLLFDPYNSNLAANRIGDSEDEPHDSELLHTLSQNLNKCKYTDIRNLKKKTDELSILSINVRSLKSNFHKLKLLEHSLNKFDIICMQETNIDPEDLFNPSFYDLEGFHSPTLQKPTRGSCKGGGLAIFINSSTFEPDAIKNHSEYNNCSSTETGEILFLELSTGKKCKNIIIGNFYRSPSFKPELFCEDINSRIEQILYRYPNKELIMLGDANIDLLNHEAYKPAQTLLNLMSQNGLVPVISRPTHVSDTYATLIDHIYTNAIMRYRSSGVITDPIADHLGTYIKLGYTDQCQTKAPAYYNYTDYSDENILKFNNLLQHTVSDWKSLESSYDANDRFNRLHAIVTMHYSNTFPTTRKKCDNRKASGKPWIMPWLQEACDRKNQLYSEFIKNPSTVNKAEYTKMKKWVEKQIYIRKKKYYSKQIETYTANARKQWKIINSVICNNKPSSHIKKLTTSSQTVTDNTTIAETFNKYFCSIAENLKHTIPNANHPGHSHIKPELHSIFLEPCTDSEIATIIKQLKNSSTSDYNVNVIKQAALATPLVSVLTQTINSSFNDGIFPQLLKTAKVIPIYKSGSKSDVSNYRPISLLSIFSKIYEKAMCTRLTNFFNKNNTLHPRQYGFRSLHSCEHALLDAQNTILSTLGKKQIALLLLIDFSKAFDMVDHTLLLNKLSTYGIRGMALKWMASYLHDRNQYVYVNSTKSSTLNLKYGVPQGSILGPLLFIIYINDLPGIDTTIHFIMYADDANIIITGCNITEIKTKAELLLDRLSNWVGSNSLKLNVKKTHYMIFTNSKTTYDLTLRLNSEVISQSREERFLGVILDDRLSFKSHRAAIAKKISRNAGIFFRARHMFSLQTLKTLYSSFIQSHLIFCSVIWGVGSKCSLQNIFVAQKKALRAVTFTRLFTKDKDTQAYSYGHTKPLFNKCELLTVHNLTLVQMLSQMHKVYRLIAPAQTRGLFNSHYPPQTPELHDIIDHLSLPDGVDPTNIILPSTDNHVNRTYFTVPQPRLAKQKQSLTYLGPLVYNYFCNKVQQRLSAPGSKYKYIIHELSPKCFLTHIKHQLLLDQATGVPDTWETTNTPMYSIPTSSLTLRLQNLRVEYTLA